MNKEEKPKKEKLSIQKILRNLLKGIGIIKEKEILKEEEEPSALREGINLIPELSKEEVKHEERKAVLNMGSALSLFALVLITIFIISFNIFSRIEMNNKQKELTAYETTLKRKSQTIIDNNDIVDRIFLYRDIEEQTFSPKMAIEYIEGIAEKSGGISIDSYDIGDSLAFEFSGSSQDLENVSKFWYLLCNDNSIETVNLDSINKTTSGATFSFSGKLIYEDFISGSSN